MSLQEIYGLFLIGLTHTGLALWVYNDIKLRPKSRLWVLGTFLMPEAFFPLYFWNHMPELVWTCPRCHRKNRAWSRKCGRCDRIYTAEETVERLHGYFEPSDPFVIILVTLLVQELARYAILWMAEGTTTLPDSVAGYGLSVSQFWTIKLIVGNLLIWLSLHCITARYRQSTAAIGLRYNGSLSGLGAALLIAPALALLSAGLLRGTEMLGQLISSKGLETLIQWEQRQRLIGMPESLRDNSMILLGFVVLVLVPVGEEILFRGLAYIAFANRFGRMKGVLFSSLLFAILHGGIRHFTPMFLTGISLFPMGLALAWLYIRTRSLIPCILTHSLINLISLVIWFGKG